MTTALLFTAALLIIVASLGFFLTRGSRAKALVPVAVGSSPKAQPDFKVGDRVSYPLLRSKWTRNAEVVGFKKRRRDRRPLITLHNGAGRLSRPTSELELV